MGVQLPRWVWIGAAALAGIAGMVNVVGYLGFEHQAVSHLTGTTSLLGAAIADGDWRAAAQLVGVVLAFMAGAALSALLVGEVSLELGRRYGVVLALESALLFASVPLFQREAIAGALLAAAACGLQNAMATTYSGAVVRTTHLSGMFTDLAISIGHLGRGIAVPRRRIALSLVIISGFLAGGVIGGLLFRAFRYDALLVPATLTGIAGIGYSAYRQGPPCSGRRR